MAVEGELLATFTLEDGASGAPVLFGAEKNQLLLALFAREDDLLGRMLHVYTSFAHLGHRIRRGLGELLGCTGATSHIPGTGTRSTILYFSLLMLDAKLLNRFNRT
jgi:hypothetical protein